MTDSTKSNSEIYNDCNDRDDSYCLFEAELKQLKEKIKHHVEVRANETVFQVWRRELLEMIK